jgi:hypothetical protein
MAHQFYFKQRVVIREGKRIMRGYVTNFSEHENTFEVHTDYGDRFSAKADRLEPDYGNTSHLAHCTA